MGLCVVMGQLFPTRQILDSSKLKEVTDDNYNKFDENGRKFSFERVENTVGKGEIDPYELFLLFPQCFQKRFVLQTCKNQGLFGKGLKHSDKCRRFLPITGVLDRKSDRVIDFKNN